MQASDQSNERLHQQASAHYLQGKFDAALATWKQILAGNPEDERASEGVRLCKLLTEDGATEAGAAANAAEEAIEFEVPNLEIDLPETPMADPVRQTEGIDLGVEPEALELDGETRESDIQDAEAELDPIVDGIFDDATAPAIENASALELEKRVQILIHEAQAAYDSGDTETARSVLTRVFILDKSNADAQQLQEQIESVVPASTEQVDVADLDAPDHGAAPGEFDLAADAPEDPAGTEALGPPAPNAQPAPSAPTEAEPAADEEFPVEALKIDPRHAVDKALTSEILDDPEADPFPELDADAEFEEQEQTFEPSKVKLPHFNLASLKTRWIVIGVVFGVFIVVGVGFWMKLRTIEIRDVPPPIGLPAEAAPAPIPEAQATQVEPEPAPQANVVPTEDLATLFERGNNALAAEEYASAILAFDTVLKQQPNHFEANERMQTAIEGYRQQQEIQQQWIAATSLFRDREYRSAMQMFYRLPENSEENRVRLKRYKENGWYNMGLLALRSGQCALARGHFEEAASVDPEDADVAMALALCETCEGGSRRTGFQRAVAAMSIRGLDD